MAKFKNRNGLIMEIPSLQETPYTNWMNNNEWNHLVWRIQYYWLPFIYDEVEKNAQPPANAPQEIKDIWSHNQRFKSTIWNYGRGDAYTRVYRQYGINLANATRNSTPSSVKDDVVKEAQKFYNRDYVGSDFWSVANYFFTLKAGTPNEESYRKRTKVLNTLHHLENYYSYNPELEQQRKNEINESQKLNTHIQQLNKYLEQQNTTINSLKKEQSKIIQETQNFMRSQVDNFIKNQKETKLELSDIRDDMNNELFYIQQKTNNELSDIRQNQNVIMDKLRNRMKRRILSDAPEIKASYNFFEDIFAGNK